MDSTFNEIQQTMLDGKAAVAELSALSILTDQEKTLSAATSSSRVGIWRLIIWVVTYALWNHEKIVSANAANSRPHTRRWYTDQAQAFLDGLSLVWQNGQFEYNLTGITDAAERKIIDRCAVLESTNGQLVIKVATDIAGTVQPITPEQLVRFTAYMQQIKDAGNQLHIINQVPDLLKVTLRVYVDVTSIDLATGKLLNTPNEVYPVKDAIDNYLANLEFNGAFVTEHFRSAILAAEGIKLPVVDLLEWKYAFFPFVPLTDWKIAEAGYFKINPEDLIIQYLPYDLENS